MSSMRPWRSPSARTRTFKTGSSKGAKVGRAMPRLLEARLQISLLASLGAGILLLQLAPFPAGAWLFQILREEKPAIFFLLAGLHNLFLFTTPFWILSAMLSCAYTLFRDDAKPVGSISLPPLPNSGDHLDLVIGECHQARTPEPVENPDWLVIGERGLFTGLAIFGAIGSGKTSCCIHPFAEQILGFACGDPKKRIGGLVLEV